MGSLPVLVNVTRSAAALAVTGCVQDTRRYEPTRAGLLVHVVREWPHVVKELRIHGPLLLRVPNVLANDLVFELGNDITQQESFAIVDAVAKTFVFLRYRQSEFAKNQRDGAQPSVRLRRGRCRPMPPIPVSNSRNDEGSGAAVN